jgi:hypothetical protein
LKRFADLLLVTVGALAVLAPVHVAQTREGAAGGGGTRTPVALPQPPQQFVDTNPVASTGKTVRVPARGDFQAALNAAQPGDRIMLEAGATYTGPFTLPAKNGDGWITVQTNKVDGLPPVGTRVTPAHAAAMPKIVTTTVEPAMRTARGAHHYRFRGIEFAVTGTTVSYGIVNFDGSATYPYPAMMTTLAEMPHHLIVEQCYIHGHPTLNVARGIQLNSAHTAVIDSHIAEIHATGQDTQALGGWSGPGPFKIVNNYLAAAGENIMFGGAYAAIPNLVPSDIEIRRNHITKPLSWKSDDPSYAGKAWTIKNLLELKNAQRVLIDGNVFEYHWPSAQSGFSIVLTPRTEQAVSGGPYAMPWATVSNITITNNVFRSLSAGIALSGRDQADHGPTVPGSGFLIRNNLFHDIGTRRWQVPGSFAGVLFMISNGASNMTIQHNTSTSEGSFILSDAPDLVNRGLVYTDNIHGFGWYGLVGPGGTAAGVLKQMFPDAVFVKNVLIGPWPTAGGVVEATMDSAYPGNFYPNGVAEVRFADPANNDFRLTSRSRYKNAGTDGKDLGADIDALSRAIEGVATPAAAAAAPKP